MDVVLPLLEGLRQLALGRILEVLATLGVVVPQPADVGVPRGAAGLAERLVAEITYTARTDGSLSSRSRATPAATAPDFSGPKRSPAQAVTTEPRMAPRLRARVKLKAVPKS